jgi:hypothetical protein
MRTMPGYVKTYLPDLPELAHYNHRDVDVPTVS